MVSSFHTHDAMHRLLRVAVGLPKNSDSHASQPDIVLQKRTTNHRGESGASQPNTDSKAQNRLR